MQGGIWVIEGDITRIEVDAIVSNDDVDGQMWSQVSRAIKSAAGSDVERQAREGRPYKLGQAWWTKAGALKLKGIVHVAAVGRQGELNLSTIQECLDNAISLARKERCRSLGMPAIGSNTTSTTPQAWFDQFADVAMSHLARRAFPPLRTLDIVLVLYDPPDFIETVNLLHRAIWDSWIDLGDERVGEPVVSFERRWRLLTKRSRKPALDLDEEVVDFFYRWDRLERGTSELAVVDFDLLGEGGIRTEPFSGRAEALERATELLGRANTGTLIGQKIRAGHALLLALKGEHATFDDYVEATLGVTPITIPEDVVRNQHDLVTRLLEEAGYQHTADGVARMRSDTMLSETQIKDEFSASVEAQLPEVLSAASIDLDIAYDLKFVSTDAYWSNWADTDPATGGMRLQVNTHTRIPWWCGKPEMLALHEIGGHVCQASMWRQRIERGELPRTAGISTVFGPESFCQEGLAQSLSWLMPTNPLSLDARRAQEMSHLGVLAWNNVHVMLQDGRSVEEALAYAHRWAPGYRTEEAAAKQAREILEDPVLRTYLYVYGASAHYYRTIAETLDQEGRVAFLHSVYSNPLVYPSLEL